MIGDHLYATTVLRTFEEVVKGRHTFAYWQDLERTQWLGRDELEAMQLSALQRLLSHAEGHCPYYRETWASLGLEASSLQSLADIRRWPLIDRDAIRAHRSEMRARVPNLRLLSKATGGSSGVPLQFDLDTESNDRRVAATFRAYAWATAGPGTRQFYLWGTALGDRPRWRRVKDDLYDRLYRRETVSAFELSEATAPQVVRRLDRHRPDVIVAYTNALFELARMLDDRGLTPYSPRSIVLGAEKVHEFQRTLIERVFRAPVFETYGSREFMLVGAECDKHQGLHLSSEHLLVEILDGGGQHVPDGAEGNVVITDLFNYGMPFIRYITGDRAIAGLGKCACGRGLPTLRKIVGRQLDVLVTPDGRCLPGELFPHLLKDFVAVRRFQVVQESPREVVIRLVLAPGMPSPTEAIARESRKHLGPEMHLSVVEVVEIPLTTAGKLQVVLNKARATTGDADTGQTPDANGR